MLSHMQPPPQTGFGSTRLPFRFFGKFFGIVIHTQDKGCWFDPRPLHTTCQGVLAKDVECKRKYMVVRELASSV